MAKLIFGMQQSLDGYISASLDTLAFDPPGPALHQHFNDHVRGLAGMIYGRVLYEVMQYWDEDNPEWDPIARDFAAVWRAKPKWVASRTLTSVGPNATLITGDVADFARKLKADIDGDLDVAGPNLAQTLTEAGLIDEYRLYFRPYVFGKGKPFFAGPRPPLRLVASEVLGDEAMRLTYVPA